MTRANVSRFLVRVEEGDELGVWSRSATSKGAAADGGGGEGLEAAEEFV